MFGKFWFDLLQWKFAIRGEFIETSNFCSLKGSEQNIKRILHIKSNFNIRRAGYSSLSLVIPSVIP